MREFHKPSNDLHIYKARIVSRCNDIDNRLQVRIVPQMADYQETEDCPKYPPLFKGQVINGFSEVQDGRDKAEFVMVLATEDFTFGYIVCKSNVFDTCAGNSYVDSYAYPILEDYLFKLDLNTNNINYDDFFVQQWVSTDDGGYIEVFNWKTGDKYIVNSSGTCFCVTQDRIYLRSGSPSTSGSSKFSDILITPNKVYIRTDLFEVDAKNVVLGKHNMKLVGTGAITSVQCEGVNLMPIKNINV